MPHRDVVVVGFSAGGIHAFLDLARHLPASFPAAIVVAFHMPEAGTSVLPQLLQRAGPLPAEAAVDGAPLRPGHIIIAVPGRHVCIAGRQLRLEAGPRVNGHRPSIDVLFRSAAASCGPNTIALLLSGNLDDGVAGALELHQRGGLVVVQDPEEAMFPGIPRSAIEALPVDHIARIADMAPLLARLVSTGESPPPAPGEQALSHRPPSEFVCPDCGGTLYLEGDTPIERFSCRVGHAFSGRNLLARKGLEVERSLWTGLRTLAEQDDVATRLAKRARQRELGDMAARFERIADEARRQAQVMRQVLKELLTGDDDDPSV